MILQCRNVLGRLLWSYVLEGLSLWSTVRLNSVLGTLVIDSIQRLLLSLYINVTQSRFLLSSYDETVVGDFEDNANTNYGDRYMYCKWFVSENVLLPPSLFKCIYFITFILWTLGLSSFKRVFLFTVWHTIICSIMPVFSCPRVPIIITDEFACRF